MKGAPHLQSSAPGPLDSEADSAQHSSGQDSSGQDSRLNPQESSAAPQVVSVSSQETLKAIPLQKKRIGRMVIGALAFAIVLMVILSLFLLDFGSDSAARETTVAISSGCLLLVACLTLLLAHLGRDYEKAAFDLTQLNNLLRDENEMRCRVEAQLREGEQMFRQLAEDSLDIVCRHAPDGTFTYVSPAAITLLGLDARAMIGHSPLEFWKISADELFPDAHLAPDELSTFSDYLSIIGKDPLVFCYHHPRGGERWLEVMGHPVLDENGLDLRGWHTRVRDVSQRVKEEEKRQEVVRGLNAIVEATDELIAIDDENQLVRRAIELGRAKLGLDRCRVFLISPDGLSLQATFGTSPSGVTADERKAPVPSLASWQEDPEIPTMDERYKLLESQQLKYWDGRKWQTLGHGWIAATLVASSKEPLGVFYHDSALSREPYNAAKQQLVLLYCSLLGALIERQRAQVNLLESQRNLHMVMQNAPLFFYSVNIEEQFTMAMGAALSLLGFDVERMLGCTLTELLKPNDPSIGRIRSALRGETTYSTFEYAGRHVQVLRQPTYDSDGHISGMLGVGVDITDRVQAEQQLRATQDRYRHVVESLNEVVFQADEGNRWTFLNASWTKILGWSESESLGKTILEFVFPDDRDGLLRELSRLKVGERKLVRHNIRALTKTNEVRWLEVFARLEPGETSDSRGIIGTLNDVSERVEAEERLRANTELQNAILSGVNYAIFACDADGQVQLFNPAAEEMLGYTAAEVIGTDADSLIKKVLDPHELATHSRSLSQEFGEEVMPGFQNITYKARHGHSDENEWYFIRRDESRFPGRLSVSALCDEKGEVSGFVGILYDLTESKRIEHLKNEFVSIVSHELRTPLTSIRGSLGLLHGGVAGDLPPRAHAMVEIAQKNVERLVVLINDILDIEKIESGKMRFEMSELSLGGFLASAVEQNRAYGEALGVHLELEPVAASLAQRKIYGDEGRLMQVLANLLSNAMKFTPAQGNVTLQASAVDETLVRISVHDEGPGVPEAFVPHLFERFAQAEESLTRMQGGTGLGLAISRAITEKHNGSIGYLPPDHDAGQKGSTFYLELEMLPVAKITEARPLILICEDDHEVAQLLVLLLDSEGYDTEVAYTLEATRALLTSGRPFAALMLDLVLPDGHGFDLLAELYKGDTQRPFPVIVVSAHCEAGKLQGEAFGIADWIEKPVDTSRILDAITQLRFKSSKTGKPRILHIEDDADVREIIEIMLHDRAEVVPAPSLAAARKLLESQHFDMALLDIGLPDGSGLSLVPVLSALNPPVPVVLFSARDDGEDEKGVFASLTKSRTSNSELRAIIERLLPVLP